MNPQIPIKAIKKQMQKKYHVSVSKHKEFREKAKAHVHLRGDVKVQYSLLRDYANELQRCNPDTTVKIDVYGGFKEGGRELLALDGAFMRGQYPGRMLTTVGVDANNGICLVAYGIVEPKNQYSWTWFLKCLADDFDLFTNSNFTFITDRQKGLVPTISKLFPSAEYKFCVRHINENMNLTWKGGDYKEMLWRCATSITVVKFQKNMNDLKDYNKKAYEWLSKIPPEHWSRAYFSVIQKSNGTLTPVVTKLFNKIKEAASKSTVDWNGSDMFQVKGPYQDQCVVNLNQKTCSCRKWEISGIPCKHAIAAIHDMAENGRPPKNKKKSKGEIEIVKGNKLTRKGNTVTCSNCKGVGHNKRGYKAIGSSDGGQMYDMPTEHVAREPVGSEMVTSQTLRSQTLASQQVARKPMPRIPVARKPVQNKSAANKRAASEIN
ncbi:mutator type transposase [Tanacetum coccineum]